MTFPITRRNNPEIVVVIPALNEKAGISQVPGLK